MQLPKLFALFAIMYLATSINRIAHSQETIAQILDACLATRESELGRYYAEFRYDGEFLADDSLIQRVLIAGSFSSKTKRDGEKVWFGGFANGQLTCVYTVQDGGAYHYAPLHQIAKRMRSAIVDNGDLICTRFIDPIGLGFFETSYEPLTIQRAKASLSFGHDSGNVTLVSQDLNGQKNWVITAITDDSVVELLIDQASFRLLQRSVTVRNKNRRFVSECEYTDRFPVRSIPTLVRFREYLNDEIVFESTREMTAFDPNPIFTENDFGLAALGLPPGSDYLDETTERFVKWNGSEVISPDFANHPLVDRDLIARKAAEEAKNNGWNKQYPMYAIAGIGILAALLLLYRQRQKKA